MTRVFRYGLLEPTLNGELVNQQIILAHRYRNKLVEIELAYRVASKAAIECDELRAIDAEIAKAEGPKKSLWDKRKLIHRARLADAGVIAAIDQAKATKFGAIREARAASNVFWGTYLQVEAAADSAAKGMEMPRFQRWIGAGAVSVQLQGGLSVEDLTGADDTRAQLSLVPVPVPDRSGKPLPRVRLRIGSEGRDPVWGEWPLIYHRSLPAGGVVKWIKAVRSVTGPTRTWSLHITVESEAPDIQSGGRILALDLRWKADELDGQATRLAGGWTDGKNAAVIRVNPRVIGMLRKAEDLRSIRDKLQNEMHAQFLDWAHKDLPTDHRDRLQHVAQWKSPRRFAGYVIWWREHRLPMDRLYFERLEAWRKKDKHLWNFESHCRARALRLRREQYRIVAALAVREHDGLVIEKIALNKLAVIPEQDDPGQHKARGQRTDTAPSELRMAFVNAFRREGKPIYEVKPGPLASVWQVWCERQSADVKAGPARSKRYNRLRGIKE